jgi:hypothetical protein
VPATDSAARFRCGLFLPAVCGRQAGNGQNDVGFLIQHLQHAQGCLPRMAFPLFPLLNGLGRYIQGSLEAMASPEATRLLENLARGEPTAPLTQDCKAALERLETR